MVVLGQVVAGVDVTELKVGMKMELVLDTPTRDAETEKIDLEMETHDRQLPQETRNA